MPLPAQPSSWPLVPLKSEAPIRCCWTLLKSTPLGLFLHPVPSESSPARVRATQSTSSLTLPSRAFCVRLSTIHPQAIASPPPFPFCHTEAAVLAGTLLCDVADFPATIKKLTSLVCQNPLFETHIPVHVIIYFPSRVCPHIP